MKKEIHPKVNKVVFKDMGADFAILTTSVLSSKETIKWEDGNEYPLIKVDISSASHPFFTGKMKLVDAEGRVDRFMRKFGNKGAAPKAKETKTAEATDTDKKN